MLFQLSKIPAIQGDAPFAEDPYDAVASFAFQIAMAIALLSLARLVSIQNEAGLRQRAPFILRGILLVELCVLVNLITNMIAIVNSLPLVLSVSMIDIFSGMALLTFLFAITGFFWIRAKKEFGKISVQPGQDALAQTIKDCWTLIAVNAAWIVGQIPSLKPIWAWIDSLARRFANAWDKQFAFADPNHHPWGFAMTFAVLGGLLIMAVVLLSERIMEGGPANPLIAFLLAGIFFAGETLAIFLSFLFLGGYLGLRPNLHH
jgi:hypothetical protein